MTQAHFQQSNLSSAGLPYDKIVVGIIIFKVGKLLLLKRFVHEIYYPNVFEFPSGNVDSNDATLAHALAQEVQEEKALKVTSIVTELLPPFEYETSKAVGGLEVRNPCVQANFLVEVEGWGGPGQPIQVFGCNLG
jgi:8-oxo-dGTP pyrophosphatase MutT (NUDIX family)